MKKLITLIIAVSIFEFTNPFDSQAIPSFSRKYGFNCNMCHTAYTKLNDFGQRFRDNGYQIPEQQGKKRMYLKDHYRFLCVCPLDIHLIVTIKVLLQLLIYLDLIF